MFMKSFLDHVWWFWANHQTFWKSHQTFQFNYWQKVFSDDQTICLMILNKSSDILQNHQQCLMGRCLFVNTGIMWEVITHPCLGHQLWFTSPHWCLEPHHAASVTEDNYRKTSCISRTKSQNLYVSCIVLWLPSLYPLKPGVKLRMKM